MTNYIIDNVYKTAGKDLTDRLLAIFQDKQQVVDWFYQPIKVLDDSKPSDLCGTKKQYILEQVISELESGTLML